MPYPAAALPADPAASHDLLQKLLAVSLTGVILFRPVYDSDEGTITDLAYDSLNPAAQRMLRLPERPPETFLTLYPNAVATGIFAFYRDTFLSGQPGEYEANYQYDGLDNYFLLAAQRSGAALVVSFSDTATQDRSAVEQALRASQVREQAARAEAEAQRQQLHQALMQLPANVTLLHGPTHVFTLVNPHYQQLFPGRALLGLSLREALPELAGQGFFEVIDQVYRTGEALHLAEAETWADFAGTGHTERRYYNTAFLPFQDAQGQVTGLLNVAFDVTTQVEARRQVEQLNQQLEAHVQERTHQLEATLQVAEQQRGHLAEQQGLLSQILAQVPAAIATLSGPEHRFTFANNLYRAIMGNRAGLGQTVAESQPELAAQGFLDLLDQVYTTGEPFVGREVPVLLHDAATGTPQPLRYIDFVYQPLRDGQATTTGILTFAVDVTEKVQTRRQAEALQTELLAATKGQVQERETLYQVFAQTPAAICIQRGPEHRYEYVNQAYQDFFPGHQLLGRPVAEALPETGPNGVGAQLDRVYQTGKPHFGYEQTLLVAQPDGTRQPLYFTFTYQAYRENGEVVGVSTFAYDVSSQVLARQQREQQARQFQELYEQAPMAVTILRGPEFIVELANPAILHIWGLTAEEALGRPRLELIPAASRADLRAVLETPYRTRQTHHVQEFPVVLGRAHSGQPDVGYFNFIYQPLFDEQGEPAALTCVGIEVTEQVLARQAVEAGARQLQLITDALPVLIGYLDAAERYRFANQAYQTWFDHEPHQLLGRTVREVVGEAAYQGVKQYIDRALTGERLDFESRMPYRADFVKYIRTSYIPDVQQGQIRGFYTLVNDITEQVLARQHIEDLNSALQASNGELMAANQLLTRTNVDLDTFIYTASHDLKAPITNIEGILLALREHLAAEVQHDEQVAELLAMMQRTVERFQLTISQLTDISKLQLAHVGPAEAVPLAVVVDDVHQDLAPAIAAAAAVLTVDLPAGLLVSFSPANLRSIVYNLLSNAVKYRDPARPAQVRLHAERTPRSVVLTVQDNGLGLSEMQQRQLFGLFQRLHTHVEGTGVGLYIIKRLVENAGGTIAVRSQPGVGSTFTVTFPA